MFVGCWCSYQIGMNPECAAIWCSYQIIWYCSRIIQLQFFYRSSDYKRRKQDGTSLSINDENMTELANFPKGINDGNRTELANFPKGINDGKLANSVIFSSFIPFEKLAHSVLFPSFLVSRSAKKMQPNNSAAIPNNLA